MGTHPIFESDFDCLTGSDILLKMSKKEIPIDTEAKLKVLDDIERKIVSAIQNAGQVMTELAKDKVNEKSADRFTDKFLKEIDEVETELTRHINYLGQNVFATSHVKIGAPCCSDPTGSHFHLGHCQILAKLLGLCRNCVCHVGFC